MWLRGKDATVAAAMLFECEDAARFPAAVDGVRRLRASGAVGGAGTRAEEGRDRPSELPGGIVMSQSAVPREIPRPGEWAVDDSTYGFTPCDFSARFWTSISSVPNACSCLVTAWPRA